MVINTLNTGKIHNISLALCGEPKFVCNGKTNYKPKKPFTCREYSTHVLPPSNITFPILFLNADLDKLNILEQVTNKSGIYLWTNVINSKKYVGSSVNLKRRLLEYYNVNRLLVEKSMPINIALLKYGYHNFSLSILEYCSRDDIISREKYYFDMYMPEYNVLKIPGSPSKGSGWKHSEAAIENMRISALNRNNTNLSLSNPNAMSVKVTNLLTNSITYYHAIRAAARNIGIDKRYIEHFIYLNQNLPVLGKYTFELVDPITDKDLKLNTSKSSKKIEVKDIYTNTVKIYSSIGAAARELKLHQPSISLYIKEKRVKPFKGKYLFKLI